MILFGKNSLRSVQLSPVKPGGQLQVFGAVHTSQDWHIELQIAAKKKALFIHAYLHNKWIIYMFNWYF